VLGRVALPNALERKYPNAGKERGWQWVFAATSHQPAVPVGFYGNFYVDNIAVADGYCNRFRRLVVGAVTG
jgi:hypothetical protein